MKVAQKNGKPTLEFHKSDVRTFKNAQYLCELFVRTEGLDPVEVHPPVVGELSDVSIAHRAGLFLAELCVRRGGKFIDQAGDLIETAQRQASDGK